MGAVEQSGGRLARSCRRTHAWRLCRGFRTMPQPLANAPTAPGIQTARPAGRQARRVPITRRLVRRLFGYPATPVLGHPATLDVGHAAMRGVGHPVTRMVGRPTMRFLGYAATRDLGHPVTRDPVYLAMRVVGHPAMRALENADSRVPHSPTNRVFGRQSARTPVTRGYLRPRRGIQAGRVERRHRIGPPTGDAQPRWIPETRNARAMPHAPSQSQLCRWSRDHSHGRPLDLATAARARGACARCRKRSARLAESASPAIRASAPARG